MAAIMSIYLDMKWKMITILYSFVSRLHPLLYVGES